MARHGTALHGAGMARHGTAQSRYGTARHRTRTRCAVKCLDCIFFFGGKRTKRRHGRRVTHGASRALPRALNATAHKLNEPQ